MLGETAVLGRVVVGCLGVSQKLMMLGTGDRHGWMGAECGEDQRWLAVGGGTCRPECLFC